MKYILSILIVCCLPFTGFACSCTSKSSVMKALEKGEVVFIGKILSAKSFELTDTAHPGRYMMRYSVLCRRKYQGKGIAKKERVTVITGFNDADCGYQFRKGRKYIIYGVWTGKNIGDKNPNGSSVYTNICFRTTRKNRKEMREISYSIHSLNKMP